MSRVPEYDISSLERGIVNANKNIDVFKTAIKKEKDTIVEYKMMIDVIKKNFEIVKVKENLNGDNNDISGRKS